MEVVLLENIKSLGQIGEIVKVKRGHGRNFLIKYGKALKAFMDECIRLRRNIVNIKSTSTNRLIGASPARAQISPILNKVTPPSSQIGGRRGVYSCT